VKFRHQQLESDHPTQISLQEGAEDAEKDSESVPEFLSSRFKTSESVPEFQIQTI